MILIITAIVITVNVIIKAKTPISIVTKNKVENSARKKLNIFLGWSNF